MTETRDVSTKISDLELLLRPEQSPYDVVVIGAGLAGLTAAYRLRQAGRAVLLIDSAKQAGGVIRSERTNGFLIEFGPNTVQPTGEIMSLLEDLGMKEILLADLRLPRYIRWQGRLHEAPLSPGAFLKTSLLSRRARLRLLAEPLIPRGLNGAESIFDFARRRLGLEAAERLVAPFVSGVWAGDPRMLSAESALTKLSRLEHQDGSLLRGILRLRRERKRSETRPVPRGLLSFPRGLQTLVDRLSGELGAGLRLGESVSRMEPERNLEGKIEWNVTLGAGERLRTRSVVLACPANAAASLVRPFAVKTADALSAIPYVPVAVLHLGFPRNKVDHGLVGFGYLTSPAERANVLGSVWTSSLFTDRAPADQVLFTVFVGGATRPDLVDCPDEDLLQASISDLAGTVGVTGSPSFSRITRYARAIPQYTHGHRQRIEAISEAERQYAGSLRFAGNYMEGISVGDVIRQATTVAGAL